MLQNLRASRIRHNRCGTMDRVRNIHKDPDRDRTFNKRLTMSGRTGYSLHDKHTIQSVLGILFEGKNYHYKIRYSEYG